MHRPVPLLLLIALATAPLHAAAESPTATDGVPGTVPDATGGGDQSFSAGQIQQLLSQNSDAVAGLIAPVDAPGGSADTLYHNLLEYNAEQLHATQEAQTASGTARPIGATIPLGSYGSVTLGMSVTDNDYPNTYPSYPQTVHFITGDKNQLASLNNKMQRASSWLNKHTCGGFDWASQFDFMFKAEVLKEYLKNLGEGVIAAAPMALLGAFSPQLAEIVKHLKLIASFDLSASKMDCQAIQNALTTGIDKSMWADNYSNCIANQQNNGIDTAVQQCQQSTAESVTLADGTQAQPVNSATANQAGWNQNTTSMMQSYLDEVNPGSVAQSGAQSASGASTAGTNGGLPGGSNEANALQGTGNAASQDPNVLASLGNDMSGATRELAETLFGSLRFQGTGALELGRKSYEIFDLKLQTHAARLRDQLASQLLDHYGLITDPSTPQDTLAQSYQNMKLWTWQSRGANFNIEPWKNQALLDGTVIEVGHPELLSERISDHTMDACAYLLTLSQQYQENDAVNLGLQRIFGIQEFLSSLSQLECYLYAWHVLYDEERQIEALIRTQPSSQADTSDIAQKAEAQLRASVKDLRDAMKTRMEAVLSHLKQINAFQPYRKPALPNASPISGSVPLPAINFGSETPDN